MTTLTADQWEQAWGEYIDALIAYEQSLPSRYKRGHRRVYKNARRDLYASIDNLKKLNPEFCATMKLAPVWTGDGKLTGEYR